MHPKDADGMANNIDLDKTAPLLFVQTCLPEDLDNPFMWDLSYK